MNPNSSTSSPLLGPIHGENSKPERPKSQQSEHSHSHYSPPTKPSSQSLHSEESTPLLSRDVEHVVYSDNGPIHQADENPTAASSLRSIQASGSNKKKTWNWPRLIALAFLFLLILTILVLGFVTPAVVREYAKEAIVFKPTDLSVDSFTSSGLKVRVQGDFSLDASRVRKKPVRDLGCFGTWILKSVKSKPSTVRVYMPEYGNVLLGVAAVPSIDVDVRNGRITSIDFLSDLIAGDIDGIRQIANDWLEGRLGQVRLQGVVEVVLTSGIFSLGKTTLLESMVFQGDDLPSIPQYKITKLNFSEVKAPNAQKVMIVEASLSLENKYPVTFNVPVLRFDIFVQGCSPEQPYIIVADAITKKIEVSPKNEIDVGVQGIIPKLPEILLTACPDTKKSPLDLLLGGYIKGNETTIFIRGSDTPSSNAPQWLTDLLHSIIVPIPFPGRSFDGLIRNFSLANVHFSLPDPFAAPGSPKSNPRLSATVKALVNVPEEMNFPINISRVRANAEVFYEKKKLGDLDLRKWQKANATRIEADGETPAGLAVGSVVKNAPLDITNDDVFADLVQGLIFSGKAIMLEVMAQVDVETETALGKFVIRDLPAAGEFFVKPLLSGGKNFTNLHPQVGSLEITDTTNDSLTFNAKVNFTNPTDYSATVPYVNVRLLTNDSILGNATVRDVVIVPGPNYNIPLTSIWNPVGKTGAQVGRDLISQYISGFNTTLTIKTHAGTIPSQPRLGEALSSLSLQVPTPKLTPPKNPNHDDDDDDDNPSQTPHFIDDATMHLLTSTCTLTLLSPLPTTLLITSLNATARHHASIVGLINSQTPFEIPPGVSTSPYLPVKWSLASVGFRDIQKALGGQLKLDAYADVGVRVGRWEERVWFLGRGVGSRVRL